MHRHEAATAQRQRGARDAFEAVAGGKTYAGRRVLFATGVVDHLPPIPGIQERWGRSVFHCPYCHGYELDRGPIGVVASSAMSLHQVVIVADWGPTTLLVNNALELDPEVAGDLARCGIGIEPAPIARIEADAEVVLSDGRRLAFAGLFILPRSEPSTSVAHELGCELADTALGTQIWSSDSKETSVPGAFACGDAARMPHSLSLAVADGAWAGAQLHRSLLWPDH